MTISKTITTVFALTCVGAFLTGCETYSVSDVTDNQNKLFEGQSPSYVAVVAHRSCWQSWPENSLQAANACLALGVDMVEVDVRLTKDNKLVIMHDETLDRTTSGKGPVSDYTLDDILALTLKDRDGVGTEMTSYHPPSLEQFLRALEGKIMINLDLKESLFEEAYKMVVHLNMEEQILIKMNASFESKKLSEASFHGKVKFMPIVHECTEFYAHQYCTKDLSDAVMQYAPFQPVAFEVVFEQDQYLQSGADTIRDAGLGLWANTLSVKHSAGRVDMAALIDPEKNWGQLVDAGVNVIQTDRPTELIQYLDSKRHR